MKVSIRQASAGDQQAILALAQGERVNPVGLHWPNFVVAEHEGALVGAVQIKFHRDGAREVGSLIVAQHVRNQGIAARLIDARLADQTGRMLAVTGRKYAEHYARWGFAPIRPCQAPRSVWRNYWMGAIGGYLFAVLQRRARNPLVVLQRPA